MPKLVVKVDVIVPVYNAASTIEEAVDSAMDQRVPCHLLNRLCDLLCPHHGGASGNEDGVAAIYFDVCVCCYDDASTDGSHAALRSMTEEGDESRWSTRWQYRGAECKSSMNCKLLIETAPEGTSSRGAGCARNRAVGLRDEYERTAERANQATEEEGTVCEHFLMLLDSDDIMHPTRIAEQTCAMLSLGEDTRRRTLMGCQFDRIPEDSTEHYTRWANGLSDERVYLEQFRECTLLQPTWCMSREWFMSLGGYVEAPAAADSEETTPPKKARVESENEEKVEQSLESVEEGEEAGDNRFYRLIHPSEVDATTHTVDATNANNKRKLSEPNDNAMDTRRLAEDTRLFYAHLRAGGRLHLHRTPSPLVTYRHREGMSQSSSTPRKLLLRLRAKAWEDIVFHRTNSTKWSDGFAIWGAGRDGKDFLKALSPDVAKKVVCFVDVDKNKIEQIKWYDNPSLGARVPILHFSDLARSDAGGKEAFGRIEKKCGEGAFDVMQKQPEQEITRDEKSAVAPLPKNGRKRQKKKPMDKAIDPTILQKLPVVVCVAMYRTNGALESNVASIGRTEGEDLWHIH